MAREFKDEVDISSLEGWLFKEKAKASRSERTKITVHPFSFYACKMDHVFGHQAMVQSPASAGSQ